MPIEDIDKNHGSPGWQHGNCNALKQDKVLCGHQAGYGTPHLGWGRCKWHGGCTSSGIKFAEKLKAEGIIEDAIARYGLPEDVDPVQALEDELARTAGHVAWLGAKVRELEDDDMVGPVGGGPEAYPSTEASIWIRLYQQEREHLTKVAKVCIDAGLDERKVRLAEQQGQIIATLFDELLKGLKLSPEQKKLAPGVVRQVLTTIPGKARELEPA